MKKLFLLKCQSRPLFHLKTVDLHNLYSLCKSNAVVLGFPFMHCTSAMFISYLNYEKRVVYVNMMLKKTPDDALYFETQTILLVRVY